VAERSRLPFTDVRRAARALEAAGLLRALPSHINAASIAPESNTEDERPLAQVAKEWS
jgi:hypothetical protein